MYYRHAECRILLIFMLNIIIRSVIKLNVVMLCVIMLSVMASTVVLVLANPFQPSGTIP
jgi:hypothetical protein